MIDKKIIKSLNESKENIQILYDNNLWNLLGLEEEEKLIMKLELNNELVNVYFDYNENIINDFINNNVFSTV